MTSSSRCIHDEQPIAHRRPGDGEVHSLPRHLAETARLAEGFASDWGAGEVARLAALWHDLGKYAAEFQDMIRADDEAHLEGAPANPRPRVDHSSAGAIWATERFGSSFGRLLAYAIAGHHAGLGDWQGEGAQRGLMDRLAEKGNLTRALAAKPPESLLTRPTPTAGLPEGADIGFWTRMLASAVFDADFLDTESFFDPDRSDSREGWPSINFLAETLDAYLTKRFSTVAKTEVNVIRADVLAACRGAAEMPPGLYSLTVPTGGGKTLSSLSFALHHARRHGLRRVIYAIPFTSIVEQTADEFAAALGPRAILEHHCSFDPDQETPRSRLAAENWDAPLIVTTTVQLFESLFAARTSRLRKIHNLARSVIILDEAQALPPPVLRPITLVLDQLVRYYDATILLCTATQPAFGTVFKDFAPREIAPDPVRLFAALNRVTISLPSPGTRETWENVAERIGAEARVLAIVNSRADCRRLHALLPEGAVHLSTRQCAAHRAHLLATIKAKLIEGETVRAVSTSLIEAGVDIDFPVVFRALAGLDSLAQAAGRCNRNGLMTGKGRFVAFRPDSKAPRGHMGQAIAATEKILPSTSGPLFQPNTFEAYFCELYWAKGPEALDANGMATLLRLGLDKQAPGDRCDFRFRSAAEKFRMIEDFQRPLIITYDGRAESLIAELRHTGANRRLLRGLQRYTVPVPPRAFEKLKTEKLIEEIEGVWVLVASDLYRPDIGLDWETPEGWHIEDLIV